MNRYVFSAENKEYVLSFLQKAKATKSNKCNMIEHGILSYYLPENDNLQDDLDSLKCNSIIDITGSDEEEIVCISNRELNSNHSRMPTFDDCDASALCINPSTVDDILHLIKENLQIEKCLSNSILNNLNELNCDQDKIFSLLSEELNFEEVLHFGFSLRTGTICNDSVVSYYIRCLLIKKLLLEYSDHLQELLNDFSVRFSEILLEELTQFLLHDETCSKVFLQFIDGLSVHFKQQLLRKFIIACENLHINYIPVIEILISPQVDFDTLSKLVDILSNTDNFNTDKTFGKLVMNVLKLLGKNIVLLEQPLKHLIGSHRSIWKSKLQKIFDDSLQECSMLSQSFRY